MFCSSDSAQKLLKTSVIPLGGVESSTSTVHLRDGLFGTGKVLCHGSGTLGRLLKYGYCHSLGIFFCSAILY
jgi:hypothetical protein